MVTLDDLLDTEELKLVQTRYSNKNRLAFAGVLPLYNVVFMTNTGPQQGLFFPKTDSSALLF